MTYTHKIVNGKRVGLTADEIAELKARQVDAPDMPATPEQKLARVGLTVEELKELLK
jgi:hypothetical protein